MRQVRVFTEVGDLRERTLDRQRRHLPVSYDRGARNQRPQEQRKVTLLGRHFKRGERESFVEYPADIERPRRRVDCYTLPRPCPFVSCRHHLYLDVARSGGLTLNFPQLEPDELAHSCSLDVADAGANRLEDVALMMNLTRERVRQLELIVLEKLGASRTLRSCA